MPEPTEPRSPEVVTLGEALIALDPPAVGALRHADTLRKGVGGAEVNVAVALSRLGHRAAWSGSLGADEFGEEILSFLRGEGVDVSGVRRDPEAPTGVYFKERRALGNTRVLYYRAGSAASYQTLDDLDSEYLLSGELLHLTGITPLLSESCRQTCQSLAELARERGVLLSFDANIRSALLGERNPTEVLLPFVEMADVAFLSDAEARILLGGDDRRTLAEYTRARPHQTLVVHSERGARLSGAQGSAAAPSYPVRPVDTVGAGDAFVAGFLAGTLRGLDTRRRLEIANACGACAVTVAGDARSMPFEEDVLSLVEGTGPTER